jgi:hypothetical protein
MRQYRDPVHRAEVLARERALEAELFGPHSREEIAEAARLLGREDVLPDPQTDWLRADAA